MWGGRNERTRGREKNEKRMRRRKEREVERRNERRKRRTTGEEVKRREEGRDSPAERRPWLGGGSRGSSNSLTFDQAVKLWSSPESQSRLIPGDAASFLPARTSLV